MPDSPESAPTPQSSLAGCLSQVAWSMLAPGLVLIAGTLCALRHPAVGAGEDWFLLAAVAGGILARFLDASPSGMAGRGRYAAGLAAAGAFLFVLAHFVVPAAL